METIVKQTRDYRQLYASSVVADLERYAVKHGMFIGKKEWTRHDSWKSDVQYELDNIFLDAILFTGMISKINHLEYVIIFDSTRDKLEFGMVPSAFREKYAADPSWGIAMYQAETYNDFNYGKQFRGFKKERKAIADRYADFCHLVDYSDIWSRHVPEEAMDLVIEAFRHIEQNETTFDVKLPKNFWRTYYASSIIDELDDRVKGLARWDPQVCNVVGDKLFGIKPRTLPSMHKCKDGLYVRYEDVVDMVRKLTKD